MGQFGGYLDFGGMGRPLCRLRISDSPRVVAIPSGTATMDHVAAAITPHPIQSSPFPPRDIIAGTKYQATEIATGTTHANTTRSTGDRMLLTNHEATIVAMQIGT